MLGDVLAANGGTRVVPCVRVQRQNPPLSVESGRLDELALAPHSSPVLGVCLSVWRARKDNSYLTRHIIHVLVIAHNSTQIVLGIDYAQSRPGVSQSSVPRRMDPPYYKAY